MRETPAPPCAREERAARARLHPARLPGAPAADGEPGGGGRLTRMAAILLCGVRRTRPSLVRFRVEVRAAFDGRVPRVLDPFAGDGEIPLEAMRLGCEELVRR